jgi:hypothetical protein
MVFDFYTKKIKVFVAEVSNDLTVLRNRLIKVMNRAGLEILCVDSQFLTNKNKTIEETKRLINIADCSVHTIGSIIPKVLDDNEIHSIPEYQLKEAQERIKSEWRESKIFIWQPFEYQSQFIDDEYDNYIGLIRQGIVQNMIYSNRKSDILFVEDIRSVMYSGKPDKYDIDKTDLFFIYNWLDLDYANEIIRMIADVINIRTLEIVISQEVDYAELVAQQILKSKLAVIYFKNTSDWALPFVQQVWKKIGGASSPTPILFVGDGNVQSNADVKFEAPQITSVIVPHEIMPVEIKVQFDKING